MRLLPTIAAMALGLFVIAAPAQAASIWGWKQLDTLASKERASYLRLFRVFGVVLFLAGALAALDGIARAR